MRDDYLFMSGDLDALLRGLMAKLKAEIDCLSADHVLDFEDLEFVEQGIIVRLQRSK